MLVYLGLCWRIFGYLEAILAPSWLQVGHLGSILALSWALLGASWAPKVSQKRPKIVENEVLDQPLFDKCSQMVPRAPFGEVLGRFWHHFYVILGSEIKTTANHS